MIRKLVDYKKLDHQLAALLIESYPYGYGDDDIITFKNGNGDIVEAVEVRTNDILYLVKISKSLSNFISGFEDNIGKELENKSEPAIEEIPSKEIEMELQAEQEIDSEFETE